MTPSYEEVALTNYARRPYYSLEQVEGFEPPFSTPITDNDLEKHLGYTCKLVAFPS